MNGGVASMEDGIQYKERQRTGFLLLQGQFVPIVLHSISQCHPQIGLLLRRHRLPARLNVGESGIGDGVSLTRLFTLGVHIVVDDGGAKEASRA